MRKGNVELLRRLDEALRAILADGTYDEIRQRYFDYDIYGDRTPIAQALGGTGEPSPRSN